jgi:hypothetical protein
MVFDVIDTSAWPLVHIVIADAPSCDAEIDAFQRKFLALLHLAATGAEGIPAERISIVMNLNGIVNATVEQQFRAASFISAVREYVDTSIYSTALVLENELVRLVLDVILSIQPLRSLNKVFEGTEEALAWAARNRARQLANQQPTYE